VKSLKQLLVVALSVSIVLASEPSWGDAFDGATPVQDTQQSPEQLQQLVAPIALYPDELVAQVLAAATYTTQVVEADRWLQEHSSLKGKQLADEVDQQPWDSSIKALTQFPSVLANMDKNLSWTSSLADAYVNQEQDVMNAVQAMRKRAEEAGNLKTTSQQAVSTKGQTIVIEPSAADIVYVPTYDPWLVYGAPIGVWPGWYSYPGLFWGGPGIAFGAGFGIGFFGDFGWGWHHWGCDWHHRTLIFNHTTYITHSRTFINRARFNTGRAGFNHSSGLNHGGELRESRARFTPHPIGATHNTFGGHAPAFAGFNHGGVSHMDSFRGRASFGGRSGSGFRGGGRG
jgi:Protein of unknown function (DUF3300)